MRALFCLTVLCALLQAQTTTRPRFEVASLKPSGPITGHPARRFSGGPGSASPGQISYYQMSLRALIFRAWPVQMFQFSMPDWTEQEFFDITAKVPVGVTKDDVPLMLRDLLEERLKLKIRRESRRIPGYVLTVARDGPKLKPSEHVDADASGSTEAGKALKFALDKDGFIILPPGRTNILTLPRENGIVRLTAVRVTMEVLAGRLSRELQLPVVNHTELNGLYDFHLLFARVASAVDFEQPNTASAEGVVPRAADPAPTLFQAVESQLGLKMQAQRVPTEFLVVDHVERIPVAN